MFVAKNLILFYAVTKATFSVLRRTVSRLHLKWNLHFISLNIHRPFKLFSSIVDLNHILTRRSVEKDLSMLLVVQGSAKEISMAFLVVGKNVSAFSNNPAKSSSIMCSLDMPSSSHRLCHISA